MQLAGPTLLAIASQQATFDKAQAPEVALLAAAGDVCRVYALVRQRMGANKLFLTSKTRCMCLQAAIGDTIAARRLVLQQTLLGVLCVVASETRIKNVKMHIALIFKAALQLFDRGILRTEIAPSAFTPRHDCLSYETVARAAVHRMMCRHRKFRIRVPP